MKGADVGGLAMSACKCISTWEGGRTRPASMKEVDKEATPAHSSTNTRQARTAAESRARLALWLLGAAGSTTEVEEGVCSTTEVGREDSPTDGGMVWGGTFD